MEAKIKAIKLNDVIFRPISDFLQPVCHQCGSEASTEAFYTDGAREGLVPCCDNKDCRATAAEKSIHMVQFYK